MSAMAVTNDGNLTKFIWRIENFSCLKDGSLQSPSFRSHSVLWNLAIVPSINDNSYVHLKLKQLDDQDVFIKYSVAFLDSNGLPLIWKECYSSRKQRKIDINLRYVARDDLFGSRQSKYLFNDTLTVECRIWEEANQLLTTRTRLAQTRFEPYPLKPIKKTFVLKVNNVSSLSSHYTLEHIEQKTWDGDSLKVRIAISHQNEFVAYAMVPQLSTHANFKVSVLDVESKRYEFADVEFKFGDTINEVYFNTEITKLMLMTYKNEFLPNDSLSLEFKCTLFFKISFSRLVGRDENFVNNTEKTVLPLRIMEDKTKNVKPNIKPEKSNKSDSPSNASQTLKNIYEEEFLSDFTLKVGSKQFPVHKAILGARSSVFRAMFTADMKEKESGSVNIPDVDADTMQRMLKFVYCDSVEDDMLSEAVSSLYAAADKYALDPLKQKCVDILKSELCASSVLGVLLLADAHQDEDMRTAALDFILENDKEIIGTELWSKFAEEYSKLAFDAIQKIYLKKLDE